MSDFSSISALLNQSGASYRIFDMGRRISKLTSDQFEKLEQGLIPYPSPYLHHAWLALMLWNPKQTDQNVVWFLKFPLDEQGFLVQAVRDDFLNRLLQNISQMLNQTSLDDSNDALKDNPFSFTPDQEKMAMFHSMANKLTNAGASHFYSGAKAYLGGEMGWENWSGVGYQGIADLVTRLDEDNNSAYLINAIPHLPTEPLVALCSCLEHASPNHRIATALQNRLESAINDAQASSLIAALLRGLSNIHNDVMVKEAIEAVLASTHAGNAEILTAIATRCHTSLQHPDLLSLYLEKLAVSEAGQAGFSRILADLMFIPVMRILILQAFRNPQRSDALTTAVGHMFGKQFAGSV